MPERRGSWDSFPQFIRWSRPPSFYAAQSPAPAGPAVPAPAVRSTPVGRTASRSSRRSGQGLDLGGCLKRIRRRWWSGLRATR